MRDVRTAFEGSKLVKIDCRGLHPSDYKKLGAKLKVPFLSFFLSLKDQSKKALGLITSLSVFPFIQPQELVPCVLLSFEGEQILMWRGREWKSMYQEVPKAFLPSVDCSTITNTSGTN